MGTINIMMAFKRARYTLINESGQIISDNVVVHRDLNMSHFIRVYYPKLLGTNYKLHLAEEFIEWADGVKTTRNLRKVGE